MSYLTQFNYQILGEPTAPKLVFLHGLMGSGANWRKITPQFEKNFQILLYDQRGHGRRFQPEQGYSSEDYANDLKFILDELKWSKIDLVGHSMGGRNALVFANLYPEYLNKLMIVDIGPEINELSGEKIKKLIEMIPTPFSNRTEAKTYFSGPFLERTRNNPQKEILAQYLYSNLQELDNGSVDWRFSRSGILETLHEGRTQSRWREIEQLRVPTLLVRGENSEDLTRDVYNRALNANKVIKGVEVPGVGHWVHSEKPEEFSEILSNFLTS
jgi:pimeloyl-ACP methyl ester carboxylesterase